jgi:hypothetical protein
MSEAWSTRWYTPLVAIAVGALVLLIVALAIVEVLVASVPQAQISAGWSVPLERADEALREGDVAHALSWWREARMEAIRDRGWEGLIQVGDASRRIGAQGGLHRDGEALARDAYMAALLRARREQSVDGLLRAASAFGELGDRDIVAHALHIAERQAAQDPRAREHVRAVAERWKTPSFEAERPITPGGVQP